MIKTFLCSVWHHIGKSKSDLVCTDVYSRWWRGLSVLEYHIHNPDEIINHSGLNQYSSGGSGNGELLRCIDDLRDEIAEIRGKTSCDQPVLHNSGKKGGGKICGRDHLTCNHWRWVTNDVESRTFRGERWPRGVAPPTNG